MTEVSILAALIFAAAILYSSVGHGGASAYLAAMALFGLAPEVMKPTALTLNIFVATIGTIRFYRAGCISFPLLVPFIVTSIPMAFLGGWMEISPLIYKRILGVCLLFAAGTLFYQTTKRRNSDTVQFAIARPPLWIALFSGAIIGWFSGLIGVGGGIFLSPILILAGWANARYTAGVSVAFILVNSASGLLGYMFDLQPMPGGLPFWIVAAVIGGTIGSGLGARHLGNVSIRRVLAFVLVVAAVKMFFT